MTTHDHLSRNRIYPAVYLIFERGDTLLLIRRFNTGYQDGNYGLVSGHIEADESATAAGVREAAEEADVVIRPEDLVPAHIVHRRAEENDHDRVDIYFRVAKWEGEPHNNEPDKCDDMQWFPKDQLPKNMVPTVRVALERFAAGDFYSEQFPAVTV